MTSSDQSLDEGLLLWVLTMYF